MSSIKSNIRSSQHSIKYSNVLKRDNVDRFIQEYRRMASLYIDYIWDNGYEWEDKNGKHVFNILNKEYEHPKYIDYKIINDDTSLSARALSSLVTQLCGILGASVERQRKRLYILGKMKESHQTPNKSFLKKLDQNVPVKPDVSNLLPELSSKCADIKIIKDGKFNAFIKIKSIGKSYGHINIPLKFTKASNKWMSKGKMLGSFQISNKNVWLRYELKAPTYKKTGVILGADQGKTTIVSFSDGSTTPEKNKHGQSLHSIMEKMARKKKGTKAFKKSQDHRKNFIHWSINQLTLKDVKQINFEKIWNITYKKKTSRFMSHWTNTIIRDKMMSYAQENEVRFQMQDSSYRSQRCSKCGYVHELNRNSKKFVCKNCGFKADADINAAVNHTHKLPTVSFNLRRLKLNLNGFFWKPNGFFNSTGEEIRVPLSNSKSLPS